MLKCPGSITALRTVSTWDAEKSGIACTITSPTTISPTPHFKLLS